MNCQAKEEKNGTCAIRLEMHNSIQMIFSEFQLLLSYVYAKGYTHIHLHSERQEGMTIGKISKADQYSWNDTLLVRMTSSLSFRMCCSIRQPITVLLCIKLVIISAFETGDIGRLSNFWLTTKAGTLLLWPIIQSC